MSDILQEVEIKKINVYALFRDSEENIHRTLEQISNLTTLPGFEFNFYYYCNDSTDNTRQILQDWCALYGGKLLYEELNAPKFGSVESEIRVSLLSYYRNKNKEMGKDTPSDYSLVIDTDLVWGNSDFLALYDFMEENQNFVAATSNCRQNVPDLTFNEASDSFYDVYAFRDKIGLGGVYFADTPFYRKEDKENFQNMLPVEVNSAFGGFCLFDSWAFDKEKWATFGDSEHVALCGELRAYGRIAIVPTSRPVTHIDLNKLNMENCKKIGEQQREKWERVNKIAEMSKSSEFLFRFKQG